MLKLSQNILVLIIFKERVIAEHFASKKAAMSNGLRATQIDRAVRSCHRFVAFAGWRLCCWFNYAPWRPSSHWNSSRALSIARVTVCSLALFAGAALTSCSTLSLSALHNHHRLLNSHSLCTLAHPGRERNSFLITRHNCGGAANSLNLFRYFYWPLPIQSQRCSRFSAALTITPSHADCCSQNRANTIFYTLF